MKKIMVFSFMVLSAVACLSNQAFAAEELTPQKTASVLNRLIELNIDGEKGFKEAADNVSSVTLKAHFTQKSLERAKFAEDLKAKVAQLGQEAEKTGSVAEAARRAWLDVKVAVTENDEKAVLEVVRAAQAKSVAEYRSALRKNLVGDARDLVAKQDEQIQDCYDWILEQLSDEKEKNQENKENKKY